RCQLLVRRKTHSAEVTALYDDLLINVTCFFRDPETFEALKARVFPQILKNRPPESPVRIWVTGCSTREEAYSMAVCWLEFIGGRAKSVPIQTRRELARPDGEPGFLPNLSGHAGGADPATQVPRNRHAWGPGAAIAWGKVGRGRIGAAFNR